MKNAFLLFFLIFLMPCTTFGQKFGYVDTQYILNKMPDYKTALQEVEGVAKAWQEEISQKQKDIQAQYDELQAEEVLLTPALKSERMREIREQEEALKEFQNQVFGFEGLYFLKQKELLQPVQEKVFEAVEAVAVKEKLQVVFDKSGDLVMIYTNPVHDYTDYVLEELGLGDKDDTIK
jgi:outer membrane protein